MNPFIDTPLTRLKEGGHHFLKRIDLEVEENKEQFVFHRCKTWFAPSTIAALASFLGDMVVIHVRMVRNGKGCQQFFKLRPIQACKGTKRTRVVFEALIREHSSHLP